MKLKPLGEQVLVITGATSGIGLVTSRMAAKRGDRLLLASRSEEALKRLSDELTASGGQAGYVVADVGREEDVRRIAQAALDTYGGFDTWVNNAGASIYGKIEETPIEDMKRLYDTNFWGVVYGSLEAVKVLKERGGALINIGSVLSERAILLQGIYSSSKHAVKGFTDALRMELEADKAPISVTLIKPSAINTPYAEHAKNYMEENATLPPPVYAPETVARAILHCAESPHSEIFVGSAGPSIAAMGQLTPRLMDKVMEGIFAPLQKKNAPAGPIEDNGLDQGHSDLRERGNYEGMVRETSLYTTAALHPIATAAILGGAAALIAAWRLTRPQKTWSERLQDRIASAIN